MSTSKPELTSSSSLAKNAIWNLLGMVAPLFVALYAIPVLIEGMGSERFGLLAVIWVGVGYFSLFDFGLGRALTKLISERMGSKETADLDSLIWTAFVILFVVGIVGLCLVATFNSILVEGLLGVEGALTSEAQAAFYMLALGIPVVVMTTGLIGILEAHQQFKAIAKIRVPLGVFTYLGPLFTLQFTPSVAWATAVLLLVRIIAAFCFYLASCRVQPAIVKFVSPRFVHVKPLTSFGGWLTVTNVLGPLMTYMDRFFIGAVTGLSAVTYYVTPYEVLVRLQMVSQAIVGVIFPAVSAAYVSNIDRFNRLYVQGSRALYWSMLPILSGVLLFGPEALQVWLGKEFNELSVPILYWLAVGWMVNVIAQPASVILQAVGRPDLTAKAHLVEFLFYSIGLFFLLKNFGLVGAAVAWTARVVADAFALNILVVRVLPVAKLQAIRTIVVMVFTIGVMTAFVYIDGFLFKVGALLAVSLGAVLFAVPIVVGFIKKSRVGN